MSASLSRRAALASVLALGLAGPLPAAVLSPEDAALQAKAVAYLESLTDAKARFKQVGPHGEVATGTLYLSRPGRARFEYDPPSGLLITSDGHAVVVSNSRLKSFQHVPLGSTPLGLFLAAHIRLDRGVRVTGVAHTAEGFAISAEGVRGDARGQITLLFADNPIRLTGWMITDAQHHTTQVMLEPLTRAGPWPSSLFVQARPPRG